MPPAIVRVCFAWPLRRCCMQGDGGASMLDAGLRAVAFLELLLYLGFSLRNGRNWRRAWRIEWQSQRNV
jgi:hypothetical protein